MPRINVVVALLFAIVPLVALARRVNVAYPILLIVGGLLLSFVPNLPAVRLPPDTVLLVFLPPMLYWEALNAPLEAFGEHAGFIRTMALGLVLVTMAGVAAVAHALIPAIPWGAAFVLGAVVAPTDAVAFSAMAARLGIPHRTVAVIEAEGLFNDAAALVFYAAAVAAVVSGTFSLHDGAVAFVVSVAGALALGAAVAALVTVLWHVVVDADLQVAISILAPFLAYLPAHALGASGVLAVVTAGIAINRFAPAALTPEARETSGGFWRTVTFLINALIFILVGLQLHPILAGLSVDSRARLVLVSLAISGAVIALRIAWVCGQRLVFRHRLAALPGEEWKHRLVVSWAGFRGGISLAAALAIPSSVASGASFPERQPIVFVTFVVIFITLVGQGLTLPFLIARLRLAEDVVASAATRRAIALVSRAALRHLRGLERQRRVAHGTSEVLRRHYETRSHRFTYDRGAGAGAEEELHGYDATARELLAVQRSELLQLHRRGDIDGPTLAYIAEMFDLEELGLDKLAAAARR